MHPVHNCRHIKLCPKQSCQTIHCLAIHLYYYSSPVRKNLSSKFDENLPSAPNSTAIIAYIFLPLHLANPLPLCDRFCVYPLFFTTTKSSKKHKCDESVSIGVFDQVRSANDDPKLYCRLVARWRHWFLL